MKRIVLPLFVVALVASAAQAVTVNLSVEVSTAQVTAAQHFIDAENARIAERNAEITAENERRAALDPPEDPLPLLATISGPKAYFEQVIIPRILDSWVVKYARVTHDEADVRRRWEAATPAQRQAALDQLPTVEGE